MANHGREPRNFSDIRRAKLHRSLDILPLRHADRDVSRALEEAVREQQAILSHLYPVLYDRTELGVLFALTDVVGRVLGSTASDASHAEQGIEVAMRQIRYSVERVLRAREEAK